MYGHTHMYLEINYLSVVSIYLGILRYMLMSQINLTNILAEFGRQILP